MLAVSKDILAVTVHVDVCNTGDGAPEVDRQKERRAIIQNNPMHLHVCCKLREVQPVAKVSNQETEGTQKN